MLNVTQTAKRLGVGRDTVYRWGETGKLTPCKRDDRLQGTYFARDEVERLAAKLELQRTTPDEVIRRRQTPQRRHVIDSLSVIARQAEKFASQTPGISAADWRQMLNVISQWMLGKPLSAIADDSSTQPMRVRHFFQGFLRTRSANMQLLFRWQAPDNTWEEIDVNDFGIDVLPTFLQIIYGAMILQNEDVVAHCNGLFAKHGTAEQTDDISRRQTIAKYETL